jgi:hypothetical protein
LVRAIELAPVLSAIVIATFCTDRMFVRVAAIGGGLLTTVMAQSLHPWNGRFSWSTAWDLERPLAGALVILVPSSLALMWIATCGRVFSDEPGSKDPFRGRTISIRGLLIGTAAIFATLAWMSHVESARRGGGARNSFGGPRAALVDGQVEEPDISMIRWRIVGEVVTIAPVLIGLMLVGWWCGRSRSWFVALAIVVVTLILVMAGPGHASRLVVWSASLMTCAALIALNVAAALGLLNVRRFTRQ